MSATGRVRNANSLFNSVGQPKVALRLMIANANKYQARRDAKQQKLSQIN